MHHTNMQNPKWLHVHLKSNNLDSACQIMRLIPKQTARSAVLGVSPGQELLIPLGFLHPGKCKHSEVQSYPPVCNGRSTLDGFRRYAHP